MSKIAAKRRSLPMAIIDSQVHAYEANTSKRPWHTVPNWPDHVTGDEMVAAMNKVGADGVRIMLTQEAKRAPDDSGLDRIVRAAVRHDFPVNMLCWGNLADGTAL